MEKKDQPVRACDIVERYLGIKERVWRAAERHGHDPASVKLIAVSKTFGPEAITPVLDEGHRHFGENRVQEAKGKWPELRARYPGIELHLIGPLQTNKVRDAVALFDCIETLDRDKLAAALAEEFARAAERGPRVPKLLVQVNTGNEPQKAGVSLGDAEAFVARCRDVYGLTIAGLMCIPPVEDDPVPHFRQLAALRDRLGLAELSMGMSGDFEAAIGEGATMVRVGSAIFGSR